MIYSFDYYNRYEIPELILCNPDDSEIGAIVDVHNLNTDIMFNDISSISFDIYKSDESLTSDKIISDWVDVYDRVIERRQIHALGLGYFIITSVVENKDEEGRKKSVTAKSCEYELNNISMPYVEYTYRLFDKENFVINEYSEIEKIVDLEQDGDITTENYMNKNCLLFTILSCTPSWKLKNPSKFLEDERYIKLGELFRTFEYEELSVYAFLKNKLQNSFGCFVSFDIENRLIDIQTYDDAIKDLGVIISEANVLDSCEVTTDIEDCVNSLVVAGGTDDVNIGSFNPIGGNEIYNFKHDIDSGLITGDLAEMIGDWQKCVEQNEIRVEADLPANIFPFYTGSEDDILYVDYLPETGEKDMLYVRNGTYDMYRWDSKSRSFYIVDNIGTIVAPDSSGYYYLAEKPDDWGSHYKMYYYAVVDDGGNTNYVRNDSVIFYPDKEYYEYRNGLSLYDIIMSSNRSLNEWVTAYADSKSDEVSFDLEQQVPVISVDIDSQDIEVRGIEYETEVKTYFTEDGEYVEKRVIKGFDWTLEDLSYDDLVEWAARINVYKSGSTGSRSTSIATASKILESLQENEFLIDSQITSYDYYLECYQKMIDAVAEDLRKYETNYPELVYKMFESDIDVHNSGLDGSMAAARDVITKIDNNISKIKDLNSFEVYAEYDPDRILSNIIMLAQFLESINNTNYFGVKRTQGDRSDSLIYLDDDGYGQLKTVFGNVDVDEYLEADGYVFRGPLASWGEPENNGQVEPFARCINVRGYDITVVPFYKYTTSTDERTAIMWAGEVPEDEDGVSIVEYLEELIDSYGISRVIEMDSTDNGGYGVVANVGSDSKRISENMYFNTIYGFETIVSYVSMLCDAHREVFPLNSDDYYKAIATSLTSSSSFDDSMVITSALATDLLDVLTLYRNIDLNIENLPAYERLLNIREHRAGVYESKVVYGETTVPILDLIEFAFDHIISIKENKDIEYDYNKPDSLHVAESEQAKSHIYCGMVSILEDKRCQVIYLTNRISMKLLYNAISMWISGLDEAISDARYNLSFQGFIKSWLINNRGYIKDSEELENATAKMYASLTRYFKQQTYTEDTMCIQENMSMQEKYQVEEDLYFKAKDLLNTLVEPESEVSVEAESFVFDSEFKNIVDKLNIGCGLYVELPSGDVPFYNLKSIRTDYEAPKCDLIFGDRIKNNDPASLFAEIESVANTAANVVAAERIGWGISQSKISELEKSKNVALDTTERVMQSAVNNVSIDAGGFRCYATDANNKEIYGMWASNGTLMFREIDEYGDWVNKAAVGRIYVGDGEYQYGFYGDAIVAHTITADKIRVGSVGTGTNFIKNGSFDGILSGTGHTSTIPSWEFMYLYDDTWHEKTNLSDYIKDDVPAVGNYYLELPGEYLISQTLSSTVPAGDYMLSYYERSDGGYSVTPTLESIIDGGRVNIDLSPFVTEAWSNDWKRVSYKFSLSEPASLELQIDTFAEEGSSVSLDGVMIERSNQVNAYAPHVTESFAKEVSIDDEGLEIRNGAITILNENGDKVIYGDSSGNMQIKGTLTSGSVISGGVMVGDWTLSDASSGTLSGLRYNGGTYKIGLVPSNVKTDKVIYAGESVSSPAFYVNANGSLHCSDISATGGKIGGWSINSEGSLVNDGPYEIGLCPNAESGGKAIYAGGGEDDAQFYVTPEGHIYCSDITIRGGSIGSTTSGESWIVVEGGADDSFGSKLYNTYSVYQKSYQTGMATPKAGRSNVFFAGEQDNYGFRVQADGSLYANNAHIKGTIESSGTGSTDLSESITESRIVIDGYTITFQSPGHTSGLDTYAPGFSKISMYSGDFAKGKTGGNLAIGGDNAIVFGLEGGTVNEPVFTPMLILENKRESSSDVWGCLRPDWSDVISLGTNEKYFTDIFVENVHATSHNRSTKKDSGIILKTGVPLNPETPRVIFQIEDVEVASIFYDPMQGGLCYTAPNEIKFIQTIQ